MRITGSFMRNWRPGENIKIDCEQQQQKGSTMSQIAPSILAADFNCLGQQIQELERCGIEILHVDVMDGVFVPSISFGMPLVSSIRKNSKLFFDVHLMVQEPIRYIADFVRCGADSVTVHIEACKHLRETLEEISLHKVKCGIALNPETPAEKLVPYLDIADMALVMSVHPGFGGQEFMPDTLKKVDFLKEYRKQENLCYNIEMDGGICMENVREIVSRGVDIAVAGTAVFRGNIGKNIEKMGEVMRNAS